MVSTSLKGVGIRYLAGLLVAGMVGALIARLIAIGFGFRELGDMEVYFLVSLPGGIVGVWAWSWWREKSRG